MSVPRQYDTIIHELIATNVKRYRELRGICQSDLAMLAKLSPGYVAQIETGARYPSADVLERLAAALDIRPFRFFMNEDDLEIHSKDRRVIDFSVKIAEMLVSEASLMAREQTPPYGTSSR